MQEVALAVVRSDGPDKPARLGPWLYRIAVRQALLYLRQAGRRRNLVNRWKQRRPDEQLDSDPLEWLLGKERRQSVRKALEGLPAGDREILMLKHSEGWSYQKIADQLGVKRHTIEYRLLKARRRLRQLLVPCQTSEVSP